MSVSDPTVYPGAYPFMGDSSQSGSKSFPAVQLASSTGPGAAKVRRLMGVGTGGISYVEKLSSLYLK